MSRVSDEKLALVPGGTLITDTPEEGRELALKMGGNLLRSMQADPDVYTRSLRDAAVQAVAIDFQTIAAANNYWRK
jgi:hypothetical protein